MSASAGYPRSVTPSPQLGAALAYAARGWPVFPCKPRDKKPLTDHGFKDASTDPATIRAAWRPGANVAVAVPDGLVVIDFDVKPDKGIDGRPWYEAHRAELPATLRNCTSGGGFQLLYSVPPGAPIRQTPLAPGVDVRAAGKGYFMAPPSIHPDGPLYQWADPQASIAPAPWGLLDLLVERAPPAVAPIPPPVGASSAPDDRPAPGALLTWGLGKTTAYGGRNNTAWRLARQALANGYTGISGEAILLDYAHQTGLPEREALRCWQSAHNYPILDPWPARATAPTRDDATPPPADLVDAGAVGIAVTGSLDQVLLAELTALREENTQLRAALEQERAARQAAEAHTRYVCQWQQVPNVLAGVKHTAPFVAFAYKQKVSACEADPDGWVSISLPAVAESQDASIPPYRERTPEQHKAVASRAEQVGRYVHDMHVLGWIETRPGALARTADGRPYHPLQIRPLAPTFLSNPLALPTPEKRTARPRKVAAICPKCHQANTRQVVCYECLDKTCQHVFTPAQADNAAELLATPDPQIADQETDGPSSAICGSGAPPPTPPVDTFHRVRDAVWEMAQQRALLPPCAACGEPRPCLCDVAGRDGPARPPARPRIPVEVGAYG